jgi:flagellar export protein FliJ
MKQVHFPLQTVHDLRELRREEAERQLAQSADAVAAAAAQLDEAIRLHAATAEQYAKTYASGALDPQEAAMRSNYLTALARRIQAARVALTKQENEYEARRHLAIAAARNAEVTAKLREHHDARYAAERSRYEQTQLDELATAAQARRLVEDK